jgi:hypothetical protein
VSATISGIEYTLNAVKTTIIEKSDMVDNLTAILQSNTDPQAVEDEINNSISEIVSATGEFNDYLKYIDFTQINTQNILTILSANNISVKEKTLQIINSLFDSYISGFTRKLNTIWWALLIAIIVIQVTYFGTMIYRADSKSRKVYLIKKTNNKNRIKYEHGRKSHPDWSGRNRR